MVELAVAKIWGCKRAHFEANDLYGHPVVTIEVKGRTRDLVMPRQWVDQAVEAVEGDKIPVVHFHWINKAYDDDLVILKAKDLRKLIGTGEFYDKDTDPAADEEVTDAP
jgi:predicted RNase H-like nuclease (RuvC/YqgF family)